MSMIRAIVFAVVLSLATRAVASDWYWVPSGSIYLRSSSDGHNDGWAYGRYKSGCCGYTYRKLYRITSHAVDWRTKLVEVAARIKDNEALVESIKALGLTPSQAQAYGLGVQSYQQTAEPGNTLYGYTAFAQKYTTPTDLGVLFSQAGRLTENAQDLAGRAHEGFSALLSQEGANQAAVASILAQGQAAAAALAASRPAGQSTYQSLSVHGGETSGGAVAGAHGGASALSSPITLESVLQSRCVACHSGAEPRAGLDLSSVAEWTDEQRAEWRERIIAAVTSDDPARRMPRGPDGQAGEPLTPSEACTIVLGIQ